MKYIFLLLPAVCYLSCKTEKRKQTLDDKQKEIRTGTLNSSNQYTAEQIGWTLTVLPDWEVQTIEDTKKNQEKGKEAIESSMDMKIDASELTHLINLRKGRFNSLLSTIQPFDESEGSYEETNEMVREVIKKTYADRGIDAKYEEDSVLIDGLQFSAFHARIFDRDGSLILRQVIYSRLINGYDFGLTVNCQDPALMPELDKMVRSSKFTKRD